MNNEDKEDIKRIVANQVKRFKTTSIFVLLCLSLFGFFVFHVLKIMEKGIFKNICFGFTLLFVFFLVWKIIQYVFKSEQLENTVEDDKDPSNR